MAFLIVCMLKGKMQRLPLKIAEQESMGSIHLRIHQRLSNNRDILSQSSEYIAFTNQSLDHRWCLSNLEHKSSAHRSENRHLKRHSLGRIRNSMQRPNTLINFGRQRELH